jgi:serine/threonine protein phosphatase PrpC
MTWKYVYTSVPGTSHLYLGSNCQDASRVNIHQTSKGEKVLIAAASDGAGSASHSELGSQLITRLAIGCVKKWLEREPDLGLITQESVELWVKAIKKRLERKAEELGLEGPRQLAGTFLLAVIGEQRSIFAQIGDGAIVILNSEQYECVFWPQNGEYQNMTYFITDEKALDSLQVAFQEHPIEELSLFTDGIQMLALSYKDNCPHKPFFEPMFSYLRGQESGKISHLSESLKSFLESDRVNDKTDDDKTLILATKRVEDTRKVEVHVGKHEET